MGAIGIVIALILTAAVGWSQEPLAAQDVKTFTSSAEITALIAKARSERKPNQPIVSQPILRLAPYSANLEYRSSVGNAGLHEKDAEMFYVIDGEATLVTGGKLVKESRVDSENRTGTGIEGGISRAVAKGDFIIIPENTPHWFSKINGNVVLMSLHVMRPVAAIH